MNIALVHPIGNGAIVVERSKNVLYRDEYIFQPVDIEKSFLLARKRGIR
jgi:hypothetical protein